MKVALSSRPKRYGKSLRSRPKSTASRRRRSSGWPRRRTTRFQQLDLLGKLILYDKQLSVNRNEACAFCHMPETGFTGPVSELNRTTGSYPGSVRTRVSERKPQTYAYAPLSPVLHYNPVQVISSAAISGTCVRP